MKRRECRLRAGFTLIELIAVLAILGIFAAAAIPSMTGFIAHGRQVSRENVARTIYLAAQNQLTGLRITQNTAALRLDSTQVPDGSNPGSSEDIRFLSKAAGTPTAGDPLIQLLDPVILDKSILHQAILIEFDLSTGVVLSAFYGDAPQQNDGFDYRGDNSERDISGARPYASAEARNQGYYGAVGVSAPPAPLPATLINVYDSYSHPLPDNASPNVLYAEILLPQAQLGGRFNLLINGHPAETGVSFAGLSAGGSLATALPGAGGALLYRNDTGIHPAYARIIWVLDYVGGDMVSNNSNSIGVKYAGLYLTNANLNVGIAGEMVASSFTEAHPYFNTEAQAMYGGDNFTVASARHLYNIRYLAGGNFTQAADIDLIPNIPLTNDLANVNNFPPIPVFTGTYNGTGWAIQNLTVNTTAGEAGLFGRIAENRTLLGQLRASAVGLTLVNPQISGASTGNAGAVCGTLNGLMTGVYVHYTDSARGLSSVISGGIVGGIAGVNTGTITDSTFISVADRTHISGGTAGGIAGGNSGTLRRILFLAIAPEDGARINPIVGARGGTLERLYYLSGEAQRPRFIPSTSNNTNYNGDTSNGVGEPLGTEEMYDLVLSRDLHGETWAKETLPNTEAALNLGVGSQYPYPYATYSANQIAQHPTWPVVEGGRLVVGFTYYELYSDGGWGYSSGTFNETADKMTGISSYEIDPDDPRDRGKQLRAADDNTVVINDGYAVEFSFYQGDLTLNIGGATGNNFIISGSGTAANPVWSVRESAGAACNWPRILVFHAAAKYGGETMYRLYIPNSVLEPLTSGRNISFTLHKDTSSEPIMNGPFNPLFSSVGTEMIRSPRHLDNIDKSALSNNYTQQFNLDFAQYCKELLPNLSPQQDTGSRMVFTDAAVVAGDFSNRYNGNGRTISGLRINAGAADEIGLFANLSGTVRNVTLDDAHISGYDYVGGIAAITESGSTIEGCTLISTQIGGHDYVGGIAGNHAGSLTGSFIGLDTGGGSEENIVTGADYVGGLAGNSAGTIDTCYVEYTLVGAASSTNVGGIAGYMDGGAIRNVFYNYGNDAPQTRDFVVAIQGVSSSTGGLVGYMNAGALTNAYSTAFFDEGTNLVIGGRGSGAAALDTSVLYLKDTGYNANTSLLGGQAYLVTDLQKPAAVTALNGGGNNWQSGSNAEQTNPRAYIYPRLSALEEPKKWPMLTATLVVNFKYYEIYPNINPKTGGNYGLWSSDADDQLDYKQKVLEDGYVLYGTRSPGNSGSYMVRDLSGKQLGSDSKTGEMVSPTSIGGVQCLIFNLDTLENYMTLGGNGIYPVRVTIGQGNASKADYFDGYINPLFGKSIYGLNEIDNIGSVAQRQTYFRDKHNYIIRTPRQLSNIGFDAGTRKGHFAQEIDIDFSGLNTDSGYYRNNNVNSTTTKVAIDISSSVVRGEFSGTYNAKSPYDRQIKTIKNLTLPNPSPTGTTASPKSGNIGIFASIGTGGVVENLMLRDNSVEGTTGAVGGLTGANAGMVRLVSAESVRVKATSADVGGIAGTNTGTLENISFVSTEPSSPITSNNPSTLAGGITAINSGEISKALYIAHAPDNNPIVRSSSGSVADAYYLSGSMAAYERLGEDESLINVKYNNFNAGAGRGEPRTSQELYALRFNDNAWRSPNTTTNVLTAKNYPYPYIHTAPAGWPVATAPASGIVYYERYADDIYGYYEIDTSGTVIQNSLQEEIILSHGYYILMPDNYTPSSLNGTRSIKINSPYNSWPNEAVAQADNNNVVTMRSGSVYSVAPFPVTINDIPTALYINPLFAKGVYATANPAPSGFAIRTPQQMLNISRLTDHVDYNQTKGLLFTLERDLNFSGYGSAVSGTFLGIFDGGGHKITDLKLDTPARDNVGLFAINGGTIKNLTLAAPISINGRDNVGGIAGSNLAAATPDGTPGIIENCAVRGDEAPDSPGTYTDQNANITGNSNVNFIAGLNKGIIKDCEYLNALINDPPADGTP